MKILTFAGLLFLILAKPATAPASTEESWVFRCDPLVDQTGTTMPSENLAYSLKMIGISGRGGTPIVTMIGSREGRKDIQINMEEVRWNGRIANGEMETVLLGYPGTGQIRAFFTTRKTQDGLTTSVSIRRNVDRAVYVAACH